MAQTPLQDIFNTFLDRQPHFSAKEILQETYTPETVPHRDEEIKQLATILMHTLRGEKPSNVFLYGKPGTGKTLVSKHVCQELEKHSSKRGVKVKTLYLNCKIEKINTPYRLLAHILLQLNETVPITGLPTDAVYQKFIKTVENNKGIFILILDEIDALADNGTLYDLTRINTQLKNARVSIVGISNDLKFTKNLDPRVKSSLSEEELVFHPYNAVQLKEILTKRAELAIREGILEQGVIGKCAALAAQEHGDARRALDLLRVAVELSERQGEPTVATKHVDKAQKKIDIDNVTEIIKTQPRQSQIILYSIIFLKEKNNGEILTGDVFKTYEKICKKTKIAPLTHRRVSDLISELEMLGIIDTTVISKGRYGRTRKISLDVSDIALEKGSEILRCELL